MAAMPIDSNSNKQDYIDIWDFEYSMSLSLYYHIDQDSIIVKRISGLENESDSILSKRKMTLKEKKVFSNFLSSFQVDSLKTEYINPLIDDGDKKKIRIRVNEKIKEIDISNVSDNRLVHFFSFVNQFFDSRLKIRYE
jgi:hypothetical protein